MPKGRDTFDLLCLVTLSCHCKIAIAYPNEGIVWLDDLALCITFRLRTLQLQPSNFQVPSLSRQSNAASTISLASCSEISQRQRANPASALREILILNLRSYTPFLCVRIGDRLSVVADRKVLRILGPISYYAVS